MKNKRSSIIFALICMTVLLFNGCDKIDSVKKAVGNDADILESAYFYDEDTGAYRTVVIVRNNTLNPIEYGFVVAKAYDENGERIDQVTDADGSYQLMGMYYWLCKDEKTAVILTNDGIAGNEEFEFNSILDHYTAVPATLEWENSSGSRQDPDLLPHGLSITGIEPYSFSGVWYEGDHGEYVATVHNDSENDYTFDDSAFEYECDDKSFDFIIVAIYRDAEGKICDAQQLYISGLGGVPDIAAGSDAELYLFADHTIKDESLTPEYYISITNITEKAGE